MKTKNNRDIVLSEAWTMYVELATRVTGVDIPDNMGDEMHALESVVSIFGFARSCLKISALLDEDMMIKTFNLLSVIRPFTNKWSARGNIIDSNSKNQFRNDLRELQKDIKPFIDFYFNLALDYNGLDYSEYNK